MLSVCIITKNEKENLERCLRCLSACPFELVVADTGSTDGTVQMVQKYTNSIYSFTWCGDFAKAKNFAVSKAKNDTVLVIDSDEYLCSINLKELEEQIRAFPKAVGRIRRLNQIMQGSEMRESSEYINRLFDRRYYRYEGRIHEQLVPLEADGDFYETYITSIAVEHSGYLLSKEARLAKAQRNISLLEEELSEHGEDPYVLYQLGKSYYMLNDYSRAAGYFAKALSFDLDPKLEYVIDMVDCNGYALLNSGQAEAALAYQGIYEEFGGRADFQFLMGLIYMNNEQYDNAVGEFLKAVRQKECRMKGVNSYLSYYNAGVIYECLGDTAEALKYYNKCGSYPPAQKRAAYLRA